MRLSDCKTKEDVDEMISKDVLYGVDSNSHHVWVMPVVGIVYYPEDAVVHAFDYDDNSDFIPFEDRLVFDSLNEAMADAIKIGREKELKVAFLYKSDFWNMTEEDIADAEKAIAAGEDVNLEKIVERRLKNA